MISDDVLRGRIPRLGTITTGRGVEATSRSGNTYSRPTRADSLVVHTDDGELADAVQRVTGGTIETDSPTWSYDVVTGRRELAATLLPSGVRQHLEAWRTAQVARRCDGVTMTMRDGRPVNEPCACAAEIAAGSDRVCSPSTIAPVTLDLPVARLGVWEVRSTSWGTAAAIKGAMQALAMVGVTSEPVAGRLTMRERQVRTADGSVYDVWEVAFAAHAVDTSSAAIEPTDAPALDAGESRA